MTEGPYRENAKPEDLVVQERPNGWVHLRCSRCGRIDILREFEWTREERCTNTDNWTWRVARASWHGEYHWLRYQQAGTECRSKMEYMTTRYPSAFAITPFSV